MPKFNLDRIRQIVGEINSALYKLTDYAKLSEDEFLSNADKLDGAKYNLIIAIEGAIDICNHIVARAGGRAPCDYADCFTILAELKIFPAEFVERLKRMAKFKNLLVHLYPVRKSLVRKGGDDNGDYREAKVGFKAPSEFSNGVYWQVDNKKVYHILKEDTQDLKSYLQGIEELITSAT